MQYKLSIFENKFEMILSAEIMYMILKVVVWKKKFSKAFSVLGGKSGQNAGLYVNNKYSDNVVGLWEADRNKLNYFCYHNDFNRFLTAI